MSAKAANTLNLRRGRPRDSARDADLLAATLKVLGTVGYARLTMEAVAESAHAGKATLYRRWASKDALTLDALATLTSPHGCAMELTKTNLRADLLAVLGHPGGARTQLLQRVLGGLATSSNGSADVAAAFRQTWRQQQRRAMRHVLERAVKRGELAPRRLRALLAGRAPLILDVGPALLLHRCVVTGRSITDDCLGDVVDHVLLPLIQSR